MNTRWLLASGLLVLVACDPGSSESDGGAADSATPEGFSFQSPALMTVGACDGLAGFEAHDEGEPVLDWSALHADVRFFAEHTDPFQMDAHLVDALGGAAAEPGVVVGSDEAFGAYATAVPGGCWVGAWPLPDPPESSRPEVRWLVPGQPIAIDGATHVLVDLRAAPEGPALVAFLETVVDAAVADAFTVRPVVRAFNGMRDEVFSPIVLGMGENLYRSRLEELSLTSGGSGQEVALGFVVGDRIAPSGARLAVSLRALGRAAILGHAIETTVAERSARQAGSGGVTFRTMTLYDDDLNVLPDRFEPDVPVGAATAEAVEDAFLALGDLLPVTGVGVRADLEVLPARTEVRAIERHEGARQASLIAIHGAAEIFFPYWDVVDTDSNARLREALALEPLEDEPLGRFQVRSLRHWSHALADSHGTTAYLADFPEFDEPVGTIPFLLDLTTEGEPVVRASNYPDFAPGDVIVSSRGQPASELMARLIREGSASASSAGRYGLLAFPSVLERRDYVVRAPDGMERTVEVDATDLDGLMRPLLTDRTHGPLTDLGHPEIYYADLGGTAIAGQWTAVREGIDAAEQVVLDMRGYPGEDSWRVANHLLFDGSPGPSMVVANQSIFGPDLVPLDQPTPAATNGYRGDVAVLISPSTQSQAEHLVLTLQAANRITVVGRPSAGANGNITALALPGQVYQSFTGMIILQPDGSTFHGRGVQVDHPVQIEVTDLAAGVDPELTRAVEVLTGTAP
ncbi:MAG: S41 family peptidase [Sandaracinaceae bacterium]